MCDDLALMRAIDGLSAVLVASLTSSCRYRAAMDRAAGRPERADWYAAIAGLLACRTTQSALVDATSCLPGNDLTWLIFEYESAVTDFEGHQGGALLRWNQAIVALLRGSLSRRRATVPSPEVQIAEG